MPCLSWDASALAKRYVPEKGSHTVDALFALPPTVAMLITPLGYAETYAAIHRKRNRGEISAATLAGAIELLRNEVLVSGRFTLLSLDDLDVFGGLALIRTHSLNASDAAILVAYRSYASFPGIGTTLLITADHRMHAAAKAERVAALNPEEVPPDKALAQLGDT